MAVKKQTSGARKAHGPKRNMFHCWDSTTRLHLSQDKLLNKYQDKESWTLACFARGKKNVTEREWMAFYKLKTKAEKDNWFKSLRG